MRLSYSLLLFLLCAAPLAAQTTHTVTVTNFQFDVADLTIEAGDTVVWENTQGFHNVNGTTASYPSNPEGFGNALANAPWTFEHTFDVPGEYGYHCDAHGAPGVGMFGTITVNTPSAIEDDLPVGFALSEVYPNPFREETAVALTVPVTEPVRVAVYDALGREVEVLHDGLVQAGGTVRFAWAPTAARTGAYLLRIEGASFRAVRKVIRVH